MLKSSGTGSYPQSVRSGRATPEPARSIPVRTLAGSALFLVILAFTGGAGAASAQGTSETPSLSEPLPLSRLLSLAEQRNLDLAATRTSIDQAHGDKTRASSGFLPTLRADLGVSHSHSSGTNDFLSTNTVDGQRVVQRFLNDETRDTDSRSLQLSGGMNLVDPPSWLRYRAATSSLRAAEAGVQAAVTNLDFEVAAQYYSLVRAEQLAEVSESAYVLAGEQLERSDALYQLGSVARTDVLQAQVSRASSERDRIAARNSVEQERARLCLLLRLPVDAPLRVAAPAGPPDTTVAEGEASLVAAALDARPDVSQLERELEASGHSERAAKWSRWPSLGADYSYRASGTSFDSETKDANAPEGTAPDKSSGKPDDQSWNVGVGLSVPIFDGLITKGAIQQAQASRLASGHRLEQLKLQVALDVRQSLLDIKNAAEEIRSARQGVTFAEESVRLQRALYESGGGTLLQWNNSQVELTRARVAQVEAEVNLRLARAGLDKALGRRLSE